MCVCIKGFEWFDGTKKKNTEKHQPQPTLTNKRNRQNERIKESRMSGNLRLWSYNNIYTTKRALTSRRTHTHTKGTKNPQQHSTQIGTSFIVVLAFVLCVLLSLLLFSLLLCAAYEYAYKISNQLSEHTWEDEKNSIIKLIWLLVTHQKQDVYTRFVLNILGR